MSCYSELLTEVTDLRQRLEQAGRERAQAIQERNRSSDELGRAQELCRKRAEERDAAIQANQAEIISKYFTHCGAACICMIVEQTM